jgi:hypothetical protein
MLSSFIREILEAEELVLPKETESAADTSGAQISTDDFAAPPTPPTGLNVPTGVAPTMPNPALGQATVQKEVINKGLFLSISAELKSTISTYEKKFESGDLSIEDAKVYLNNFLETLAYNAERIANILGEGNEPEENQGIQVPEPVITPEPSIEAPTAPEMAPEAAPAPIEAPGKLGLSEPVPAEIDQYTNPSEAV